MVPLAIEPSHALPVATRPRAHRDPDQVGISTGRDRIPWMKFE